MLKKRLVVLCLGLLVATGAFAEIGTIDVVPAATLLLPYFEVDLDNPQGVTTLLSINNAADRPVLAHVSLWSDLSVHVFDFMIYLTGYDVQTINLRDILVEGRVPTTATDSQDPDDTISPQGLYSQDGDFPICENFFPLPELPGLFVDHLQKSLTGQSSPLFFQGLCAGTDQGDNIARGYVVVNTVNNCTVDWPGTPGYFVNGGVGVASNENVLWGDYFYVDQANNFAQGDPLVHIEADALDPLTATPGEYTFFGRYVNWSADDNREPLPTTFLTRFLTGGGFDGGTDLVVWRDSKVNQTPFTCGTLPFPYPLAQNQIVIFDEEENPAVVPTVPFSPQIPEIPILPFPWEANRTTVGGPNLPVPWDFGWLYLNLNTTVGSLVDPFAQAWVSAVMSASGRFSVGFPANMLHNASDGIDVILPP